MKNHLAINNPFWAKMAVQALWPRDTADYVFLGRFVHAVGKAMFGDAWTERDPGIYSPAIVVDEDVERRSDFTPEGLVERAQAALLLGRVGEPSDYDDLIHTITGEDVLEQKRYGIEDERRRRFFRVYDDKNNRAPPSDQSDWYQMASVSLGNDPTGGDGDNMGVVLPWSPPDAFEGVTAHHLRAVQAAVGSGTWRLDQQATAWVGLAVARAMGFALRDEGGKIRFVDRADRVRTARLVSTWIENDALRVVEGKDERRKMVRFVEVGEPCQDGVAPPVRGGAEQGGAVEPTKCSTTTPPPMGVGGGAGGAGGHKQVEQNRGGAASQVSRFPAGNPAFRPIDGDDPAADAYDAPRTVF